MKISFVLPHLSDSGGTRVIYKHATNLSNLGHDVTILYPFKPPNSLNLISELGIKNLINKLLHDQGDLGWDSSADFIRCPYLSTKYIDRHLGQSDAIIATSWRTVDSVVRSSIPDQNKYQFIQHYEVWDLLNNESIWEEAEKILDSKDITPLEAFAVASNCPPYNKQRTKNKVDKSFENSINKITVSDALLSLVENVFNHDVHGIVENAVDHSTFHPDPDSQTHNGTVTILAPYRTAKWKGASEAIEAFKIISSSRENIDFYMFGPTQANVPDFIQYYNRISDDRLRKLYSEADIFLFPSWTEGFGLPPLEAMACRCSLVSTDVGGIRNYTPAAQHKYLCQPRDHKHLASKCLELINNGDEMKHLQQLNEEHCRNWTWESATRKFEGLIS